MNYKTFKKSENELRKLYPTCVGCLIRSIGVECPKCKKVSYSFDEEYAYEPSIERCPWCNK